jgi:hypothetical protein
MPTTKNFTEKKTALETKRQQLAARIAQLEAAERTRQRKQQTRLQFLVGITAIEHAKQNPDFARLLAGILNASITRPEDRKIIAELFETSGEVSGNNPPASPPETGQASGGNKNAAAS